MSAEGRITSQVMQAYCQQKPTFLPCRVIEGDLWWIGGSVLLFLFVWAVGIPMAKGSHSAVKSGKLSKLLSWTRFWHWFRQKENTVPVGAIAAVPALMFVGFLPAAMLVWFLVAFSVYLLKNWNAK